MGRSARPTCQRCAGRPHPATTTEKFSFSGSTYEIDLCDAQADALYRDFFGWARLGREITSVERIRRTKEEREATIAFPKVRRVEVLDPPKKKATVRPVVSSLPPVAESWRLSTHAQERCKERNITREQALWAAVDPAVDRPNPYGDGDIIRLRTRGSTLAVVNGEENVILTVWDITAPRDEQEQELDYAASHSDAA